MKNKIGTIVFTVIVLFFLINIITKGNNNISKESDLNKKIIDKVTIVSDGKIDSDNDGKLVLVTGKISYDEFVKLPELDDDIPSFKVTRNVEDYQELLSPGGTNYNDWVNREEALSDDDIISSLYSETFSTDTYIGEFKLDDLGMSKIDNNTLYSNEDISIGNLKFDGLTYSYLNHKDNPVVGDTHVSYYYYDTNKYEYITILAKQNGATFEEYDLDSSDIYYVFNGQIDSKEKLEKELNVNTKSHAKRKLIFIIAILVIIAFIFINNKKR